MFIDLIKVLEKKTVKKGVRLLRRNVTDTKEGEQKELVKRRTKKKKTE